MPTSRDQRGPESILSRGNFHNFNNFGTSTGRINSGGEEFSRQTLNRVASKVIIDSPRHDTRDAHIGVTDDLHRLLQAFFWWTHSFILFTPSDRNRIYFAPRSRLDDFGTNHKVGATEDVVRQDAYHNNRELGAIARVRIISIAGNNYLIISPRRLREQPWRLFRNSKRSFRRSFDTSSLH